MLRSLLPALLMLIGPPVFAAEPAGVQFTARGLAEACTDGYAYYNYGRCSGYIMGTLDLLMEREGASAGLCPPALDGAVSDVLVDPVAAYLGAADARLDRPATEIVIEVLRAAFPCEPG
jgi:hypothetical protein